ncbi:krev interaction trapped protein 1-like isoform 1 [Aphelenchoides avenae]|nr:krev interaction trapped protein 1-like isoform 1 [Aphelenchus avenae]
MIEMEKYDKLLINPIFASGINYARCATAPEYFSKGRKVIVRQKLSGPRSPSEIWESQYPLHKAAYEGDYLRVRDLLNIGYDPNEQDTDSWTPLHYCAFYNRFEVCQELMLHRSTDVNVVNKTGSTPLHFAALNGNAYLVELILSHQHVDINITDSNGRTPLDLCEKVPKPEWQSAAVLLRSELRPNKLEVVLASGSSLQIEVENADTVTAGDLRDSVLAEQGLSSSAFARIFSIWLVSDRLSLQLKAEQKVKVHLDKWPEHLDKWGDPVLPGFEPSDGVKIILRRDARTLLGDEQALARKSSVAISLLYGEAEQNFLRGLYICNEKSYVQLAAIILHRLYGAEQTNIDTSVLQNILPRHLIPAPSDRAFGSLVGKIQAAHRSLRQTNLVQLQFIFLQYCWNLNVYGCTFFKAVMLMTRPLRGHTQVQVGLNDWGMIINNTTTYKQVAALDLKTVEVHHKPNTNYLEVTHRKKDFVATITTPQAMLINNLLKQLKTKVEAAGKAK